MDESELLVPANRAGPIRPKSFSLFLLTQPGHNNNIYNSSIDKISSTSYINMSLAYFMPYVFHKESTQNTEGK